MIEYILKGLIVMVPISIGYYLYCIIRVHDMVVECTVDSDTYFPRDRQ